MKVFTKNRKNQKVCVVIEGPEAPGKLAFVMHGLSGNKQEPHIRSIAEAFLESGYTVITFDTTNTFGESDGQFEDATLTGYYNDLEDVIDWAAGQSWYVEPFVLAGHSFGGIATSLFAERHPEKVKALAPISSVISGELTLQTPKYSQEVLEKWKNDGFRVIDRSDGGKKRLKWACVEDRLKYSLLPEAHRLTMPVLLVVGSKDESTPPSHNQILFDKLPGKKEMHIIEGAVHTFDEATERQELKETVHSWLGTLKLIQG
jgi:pimeloyl-ACP methyl ester carboxylesterase